MSYERKRNDGSYVNGTIMFFASVLPSVVIIVYCLMGREKRRGHRKKSTTTHRRGWERLPKDS